MTIISLALLLLVNFCLIPCGKAGVIMAEAKTHTRIQHGGADMHSGHNCHATAAPSAVALKAAAHAKCLHCDTLSPAIPQTVKIDFAKALPVALFGAAFPAAEASTPAAAVWSAWRPPGPERPIHQLNSVYII